MVVGRKWGRVVEICRAADGVTEAVVEIDGKRERALNYDAITGCISPGDKVLLNTLAGELGLGTGGYHFVMANASDRGARCEGPGHIVKARYTPCQVAVLAAEEEDSPYRAVVEKAESLDGAPVVAILLHSMLAPVCAAVKERGSYRLAYVMTPGGALPVRFSRLVSELKESGLLDVCVTSGQAFGGDLETVSLHSGLLAARYVGGADVIVAGMGPGMSGTGTRYGFSGIEQVEIIHAAYALGGRPVAAARISFADPRERHQGVSHHTVTVLKTCLVRATVALPVLSGERRKAVYRKIEGENLAARHEFVERDGRPAVKLIQRMKVNVTSMGRSMDDDPIFFEAAGAAGVVAVDLLG